MVGVCGLCGAYHFGSLNYKIVLLKNWILVMLGSVNYENFE